MFFGCCCCGSSSLPATKVLLWNTNNEGFGGLNSVKAVYDTFGVVADLSTTWSGILSDYGLIIFLAPISDPSWWGQISGATWTGRILLAGEFQDFTGTNNFVNSKTGLSGLTLTPQAPSPAAGCSSEEATVTAHALTTDTNRLFFADSSSISGGNTLYTSPFLSLPIIQQNRVGDIDWVVSGDSSCFADHCPSAAAQNAQFLCNIYKYPLP